MFLMLGNFARRKLIEHGVPFVSQLLRQAGLRSRAFANAPEALAALESSRPGCMVLDVRMAGMTGVELLTHLAAAGSRIPVIMLTAHADEEMVRRSLEAGAVAFLEKPVRTPALLEAIRRAFAST